MRSRSGTSRRAGAEPPGAAGSRLVPPHDDDERWLALRVALWPECSEQSHLDGMRDSLARGHHVRLAVTDGAALGFVEASKRVDYVNGTTSSPVAFLEGLYVVPAARRQGLARTLVESVASWARTQRCVELASDALLDNTDGHRAHLALGFEETERVVYFRRRL